MTFYNLSYLDNATAPTGLVTGVNDASNGLFGGLLLLFLFLLIFAASYKNGEEFEKIFLASSWLVAILAGVGWGFGLVEFWVVGVAAIPAGVALILVIWTNS